MDSMGSLSPEFWSGLSAIAAAFAAAVSAFAVIQAVYLPDRERAKDRSEATHEIMEASAKAVSLFNQALWISKREGNRLEFGELSPRASHLHVALDRLLNRPSLSDGAIITGAGAMQLMDAVIKQEEEYSKARYEFLSRPIIKHMELSEMVVAVTLSRAEVVARYAVNRKWPKWERRFADIASNGLQIPDPIALSSTNPVQTN